MIICTFDGTYARWSTFGQDHVTTRYRPNSYVEEDLGPRGTRQLCYGLTSRGNTIKWADSNDPTVIGKAFAADISGVLLSEADYEERLAKLATKHGWVA